MRAERRAFELVGHAYRNFGLIRIRFPFFRAISFISQGNNNNEREGFQGLIYDALPTYCGWDLTNY